MKFLFSIITLLLVNYCFAQTARINFTAPGMYPEGVAWSAAQNCFFVSSATTGAIGKVTNAGQYTVLYTDSTLKSTFGMKVQAGKNILWVCTGDPNYSKRSSPATFSKMARIIGIDINTGKKTMDIDLAPLYDGKHFINDISIDDKGNIFATDSYSPVIYKIDAAGKATVFATSELFKGKDVALNGIVYHPDGFLLVAHNANGSLLKVPVNSPGEVSVVKIPMFFPGADGLSLDTKGNLLLIQNKGVDKIYSLSSNDKWVSATITTATAAADRFQNPTTGTFAGSKYYVLNAKLNELSDSSKTPSKEFSLQEVQLKPVR